MSATMEQVTAQVRSTFAELTRYPLEVLELDADFEQDLGIDSVKLNEVLALLRERYELSSRLEVPSTATRTIRGLAGIVVSALGQRGAPALGTPQPSAQRSAPTMPQPAPQRSASARSAEHYLAEVQRVFSELTRYPLEVLEPDADLEQDLGVDSVKLNEVLAALRESHGIENRFEVGPNETRSLGGIAALLARTLAERGAPAQPVAARAAAEPPAPDKRSDSGGVSVLGEVFTTFAQLTRYPIDVLEPDADLEQELGIDSVKLNEVLAALRERFQLDASVQVRTDRLRTIRAIADFLAQHAGAPRSTVVRHADSVAPPRAAAPAPVRSAALAAPRMPAPLAMPAQYEQAEPSLRGKVVLITGSGHGLGRTTARLLAQRGARVVINSFHSRAKGDEAVAEIRAAGGSAEHVWGSVAKPDQVERMFQQIAERFGELDFMISNASNGHLGPVAEIGVEHWEKAFRTNVMGFHQSAVAASRMMKPGGAIVSMSCTGASRYLEHFACLGAVKAAVESLTRSLAVELGSKGIRVNCVSAGPIEGDLLNVYPDRERLVPHWQANTPTGRLCSEQEVAEVAAFLLSPAARQINGAILTVDGGGSLRI